jgi:adenylate kinase
MTRIASGELLHAEVAARSIRGRAVRRYMAAGELVPDDLLVDVVVTAIAGAAGGGVGGGVVLDGFPRTAAQARLADEVLAEFGRRVLLAVDLVVAAPVLHLRLARRAGELGRFDDSPAAAERRLAGFGRHHDALVAHYRATGVLERLDAAQPRPVVAELLRQAVRRATAASAASKASTPSTAGPSQGRGAWCQ